MKPGERAGRRPPRFEIVTPAGLKRGLGSPALFGIVQGFVAASIYFLLGIVAQKALGFTWIVYLASAVFFLLLVLSYVEGASLHQERGGATVIARYAFNELWSFVAGWAIMLDYILLIAITAFAASDYAAVFVPVLQDGVPELLCAFSVIGLVAYLNLRGAGRRRYETASLIVLADLVLQSAIVIFGLLLLLEPDVLLHPARVAGTPPARDLLFAFTATLATYAGVDASSGLAGEVAIGRRGLKRLISVRLFAAFVPYVGIALIAVSVLPFRTGLDTASGNFIQAPMLGIVQAFHEPALRGALRVLVGASALLILVIACNSAMLGLSRLGYSLALNRQIPSAIGRLHPQRATPVVVIVIGALLAAVLVITADLEFLTGLYAFGATLSFTIVHVAVCRLRWREPDRDRPFKIPLNVRVGRAELPLTAVLGALVSAGAFASLLVLHTGARWVGLGWMAFGLALYLVYRTSEDKPVFRRVTISEQALRTRGQRQTEFGSILVPVLGSPLDDDIMQTAGRLAGEENDDAGEGGAVIEAIWVFEIPMALPLDSRISEQELRRGRAALARAKAVGEEYQGVEVATATVRARRAGEGIVHEARRRGVEAIVLAAEEPTRMRGGPLLGGKRGLYDTFVGETTRYVVTKAPCRVILTAPPATGLRDAPHPTPVGRPAEDPTRPPGADGDSGISDPAAADLLPG